MKWEDLGTKWDDPGMKWEDPEMKWEDPGIKWDDPGMKWEVPGTKWEVPGTKWEHPGTKWADLEKMKDSPKMCGKNPKYKQEKENFLKPIRKILNEYKTIINFNY